MATRPPNMTLDNPFTTSELLEGMSQMKKGKATGPDDIPIEVFSAIKDDPDIIAILLEAMNDALFNSTALLQDWKNVIVAKVHKSGEIHDPSNYRPVALMSHIGKVFEHMIVNRIQPYLLSLPPDDTSLRDHIVPVCPIPANANGFVPNRCTEDSILVLRHLSSCALENGRPFYAAFLDFTKAYDRTDRELLFTILHRHGIPPHLLQLITQFHQGAEAQVRVGTDLSDPFALRLGLKQGSVLSPLLFNVFMGAILRQVHEGYANYESGLKEQLPQSTQPIPNIPLGVMHVSNPMGDPSSTADFSGVIDNNLKLKKQAVTSFLLRICELVYADDVTLVSSSDIALQLMVQYFQIVSKGFGQLLSPKKSTIMVTSSEDNVPNHCPFSFIHQDTTLENFEANEQKEDKTQYTILEATRYLGNMANNRGTMEADINTRSRGMYCSFTRLKGEVFHNGGLHFRTKFAVFNSVVLGVGLYACPCWNLAIPDMHKLEQQFWRFMRQIVPGCTWDTPMEKVILKAATDHNTIIWPLEIIIQLRMLTKLGKILRQPATSITRSVVLSRAAEDSTYTHTREGGVKYRTVIQRAIAAFNLPPNWKVLANDQKVWEKLIEERKTTALTTWLTKRENGRIQRRITQVMDSERTAADIAARQRQIDFPHCIKCDACGIRRRWLGSDQDFNTLQNNAYSWTCDLNEYDINRQTCNANSESMFPEDDNKDLRDEFDSPTRVVGIDPYEDSDDEGMEERE